jgi:hypothetical protein
MSNADETNQNAHPSNDGSTDASQEGATGDADRAGVPQESPEVSAEQELETLKAYLLHRSENLLREGPEATKRAGQAGMTEARLKKIRDGAYFNEKLLTSLCDTFALKLDEALRLSREWAATTLQASMGRAQKSPPTMTLPPRMTPLSPTMYALACHLAHLAQQDSFKPVMAFPIGAVVHATASLEAFLNEEMARRIAIQPEWAHPLGALDRLNLEDKWVIAAQLLNGQTFSNTAEPFQSFQALMKLRNELVHRFHR